MSKSYPVDASADDWYEVWVDSVFDSSDSTDARIYGVSDRTISDGAGGYIEIVVKGFAVMDTSGIVGAITKAKIHWYDLAGSASSGEVQNRRISIYDPVGDDYGLVYEKHGPLSSGWQSAEIAKPELAHISRTGDTKFMFRCADAAPGTYRTWDIQAWDWGTGRPTVYGTRAIYLEVWTGGRRYRITVR